MLLSVVAMASVSLAACGTSATTTEILPGTGPIVTVQMRGGLCPEGMCDNTVVLERDGRVHSAAKPPNDLGVAAPASMAALNAAIAATDFAALRSRPFDGVCPIAFDGSELVFEFATLGGRQRLASCEVEIDWGHPLFVAVGAALAEWVPLPVN